MAFLIGIFVLCLLLFAIFTGPPFTIKSHWQKFFDGINIPSDEFYKLVEEGLRERKITHVDIGQQSFVEKHIFSAMRYYLRVTQDEYIFYICAAPYGTGTFVSSWLCVKDERFINKIPILSKLAGKDRSNKTFYQMDTEGMFQSAVHTTVMAVIESMTEAKGFRGLTEFEKQFQLVK